MTAEPGQRRARWREDPRVLLTMALVLLVGILAVEVAAVLS